MQIQTNISLKDYTTTGIGGKAKYFVLVSTQEELIQALKYAQEKDLKYFILGGGSNLLVSDQGFDGLVIKNEIDEISIDREIITVSSGTHLGKLISLTIKNNLAGLHKLMGIPGTVGGAIFGNAGAYGVAAGDHIIQVTFFDGKTITTLTKDGCKFGYRESIFKTKPYTILEAKFKLEKGDTKTLMEEVKQILPQRSKYSGLRCPGSFFKNIPAASVLPEVLKNIPEDKINHGKIPAGYLLESIGAKGKRIGDIQVSEGNANLIVNLGEGTSKDWHKLVSELVKLVQEKFGITLEPEVQLINLPPLNN